MQGVIENAQIESTQLGKEDHGIFTCMLHLSFGGTGQGFGGYCFDTWSESERKRVATIYGMKFIMALMETLEVTTWEGLKGVYCRADHSHSKVYGIGHLLKDKWFYPDTLLEE